MFFIFPLLNCVEKRFDMFCQMHTHIRHTHVQEAFFFKWLNQQQQRDICICRTCCVPAGGYRAYIQVNGMFVHFLFLVGGNGAATTKIAKPQRFGEQLPCMLRRMVWGKHRRCVTRQQWGSTESTHIHTSFGNDVKVWKEILKCPVIVIFRQFICSFLLRRAEEHSENLHVLFLGGDR